MIDGRKLCNAIEIFVDAKSYDTGIAFAVVSFRLATRAPLLEAIATIAGSGETTDDRSELVEAFRHATFDARGKGWLVYFPRVPWPDGYRAPAKVNAS